MNILLVEDNPADMRLVREALAESALDVALDWAADGPAALARLRDSAQATPDLVLLDLNLPGMGGQEVLAEVKRDPALASIPVVVLSSSAAPQDVLAAYRAHANAYMVKPSDYVECLGLVERLRAYWQQAVLLPSQVR